MPRTLSPLQFQTLVLDRLTSGVDMNTIATELGMNRYSLYKRVHRYNKDNLLNSLWPSTLELPKDPTVLAYIAGIIDGEGCILTDSTGKYWYVKVAMTDIEVIDWLVKYGGKKHYRKPSGTSKLDAWSWDVNRQRDVRDLLITILPYMVLERKRFLAMKAIEEIDAKHLKHTIHS